MERVVGVIFRSLTCPPAAAGAGRWSGSRRRGDLRHCRWRGPRAARRPAGGLSGSAASRDRSPARPLGSGRRASRRRSRVRPRLEVQPVPDIFRRLARIRAGLGCRLTREREQGGGLLPDLGGIPLVLVGRDGPELVLGDELQARGIPGQCRGEQLPPSGGGVLRVEWLEVVRQRGAGGGVGGGG